MFKKHYQQENTFFVVTEIYFNNQKVSISREYKKELSKHERNKIVKTMFHQERAKGKYRLMDIYTKIEVQLKEVYNIFLCDRSVMRICTELQNFKEQIE